MTTQITVMDQVLDAVGATLRDVEPPLVVIRGKPWTIDSDRSAFYYYAGDDPTTTTSPIDARSYTEKIAIRVFWKPPANGQMRAAHEAEVWGVKRAVHAGFTGRYTLGIEGVLESKFEPSRADIWQNLSGALFESLEIDLLVSLVDVDLEVP